MRPLEIIYVGTLLLVSTLCLAPAAVPAVTPGSLLHLEGALLLFAAAVLALHAWREGLRWQMGAAYAAILPLLLAWVQPSAFRTQAASLGGLALLTSLLLGCLMPMFHFTPLTGPYPVGTSLHHLVDTSRQEDMPSPATHFRELMIQAWYPASPSREPLQAYRRRQETTRLSSYQAVLRTRSRTYAPILHADQPLPILIFHPAWNGRRTQNTFLTEELASHGFLVVAVDHTFNSEPVAFPDGRVVRAHHSPAIENVASSTREEVIRIGSAEVHRQFEDNAFVLDTLHAWNSEQGSRFFEKLDTRGCGVLGHSLGGAVAIECFRFDPRVLAAMNMDGWNFGTPVSRQDPGLKRQDPEFKSSSEPGTPDRLLFFHDGSSAPTTPAAEAQSVEAQLNTWDQANVNTLLENYGGYHFHLQGANHLNFTDRPASSPLRRLSGGGPIPAARAHRILCDTAVSFFSQALLSKPANWLDDPARRYPEVEVPSTSHPRHASLPL